ncbi:MAG: hypothetical protein BMS9Abin12_1863 [Acidimicrobiia bacterium]|nr:MAG: hypothetical protein BMS9Abin12_1863 [Acidimicrobiia bacterium]
MFVPTSRRSVGTLHEPMFVHVVTIRSSSCAGNTISHRHDFFAKRKLVWRDFVGPRSDRATGRDRRHREWPPKSPIHKGQRPRLSQRVVFHGIGVWVSSGYRERTEFADRRPSTEQSVGIGLRSAPSRLSVERLVSGCLSQTARALCGVPVIWLSSSSTLKWSMEKFVNAGFDVSPATISPPR